MGVAQNAWLSENNCRRSVLLQATPGSSSRPSPATPSARPAPTTLPLLPPAHRYLASWPRRTAAPCSAARSSGVTKGEGVSSRTFW